MDVYSSKWYMWFCIISIVYTIVSVMILVVAVTQENTLCFWLTVTNVNMGLATAIIAYCGWAESEQDTV